MWKTHEISNECEYISKICAEWYEMPFSKCEWEKKSQPNRDRECWTFIAVEFIYILRRNIIVCDEVSDIAIEFVITVCGTTGNHNKTWN